MGESWTNSGLAADLLVELRRSGPVPLHGQIAAHVRAAIRDGRLRPGAPLPPTRAVATGLGVSRGVVVEAYQQLTAEGYLASRPGGYTRVAAGTAPPVPARALPPAASPPRVDFGYGRADVAHFPRAAWLRSVRRVLTEAPGDAFGYAAGRGAPELRTALADYLDRVRGTCASPDDVIVCNGWAQGLTLLTSVLRARGARRIAVEDPSIDDDVRPLAAAAGLEVVGVPVDEHGIRVSALDGLDADLLVLTPSHQWPTGGVLPAESRAAVLRWARDTDALIAEDDYDAEYRYDRQPLGAIQGLDPARVVYGGSASKTLAPGLRLGWLLTPPRLTAELAHAKIIADRGSPIIDQLTFADFLTRGEFDRHLRRMRPVYRRRRDALLAALATHLPGWEPAGAAAGLHLVAWLPAGLTEDAVVAAAAACGIRVHGVGPYRLAGPGRPGLIFGYAAMSERALAAGVRELAAAVGAIAAG